MVDLLKWLSRGLLVAALVMMGLAGWFYYQEQEAARLDALVEFEIPETIKTLEGVKEGTTQVVHFTVRNHSNRPMRVVGVEVSCGANYCCVQGKSEGHVAIPPGGSAEVPCEVRVVQGAGGKEFKHDVAIFIDDGRWLRQSRIGVQGIAVAAEPEAAPANTAPADAAPPAEKKADD